MIMRGLVVCGALLALSGAAEAASLRALSVLSGPDVRLSDLFDDAGPEAGRVLGPGPAPGARLVLEAPQLNAIARQFGVDWRSASGSDRMILQRPGQPVPREAILAALRAALAPQIPLAGALDIDLPGFSPPMMPLGADPRAQVDRLNSDPASGRFSADLSVSTPSLTGGAPELTQFTVSGIARQVIPLPVLTRRLAIGEVVQPGDVRLANVPVAEAQATVARAAGEAVGQAARRQMLPGQPILLTDLGPPILVRRGGSVLLALEVGGLSVTAQGMALESGGLGEHVHVLNPLSRAIVDAEVTGVGRGRVTPGTVSTLAEGRAMPMPQANGPGVVR